MELNHFVKQYLQISGFMTFWRQIQMLHWKDIASSYHIRNSLVQSKHQGCSTPVCPYWKSFFSVWGQNCIFFFLAN